MLPLHFHEVAAAHGVCHAVVRPGCKDIEYRLVFIFFRPLSGSRQTLFFSLRNDFIDVPVCFHRRLILLIAFKLVQKFKADSERIGLVGIAVHLIVTVGISHHILSHLSHPSLCGTGHRNSYGAGRIGGLNSLHRLRSCLQGTDYRDAAAVQLFGGRVDKFIACIGGCPKTFGLALEQVQSGENRRLGSAAGHKIDMFQSPRRIYFIFNLADNFFNAHIMSLLSGQPEAAAILLYFYSV